MKSVFKLGLLLVTLAFCTTNFEAEARKDFSKSIKRQFDITATGTTSLANKYGKVEVKTWDQNQVKIDVTIIVRTATEKKAQEVFDRIDVSFSNGADFVSAETNIERQRSSWWDWGTKNSDYTIEYVVHLPATNNLKVANKYGDVLVESMKGKVALNVKYGNFRMGRVENDVKAVLAYGNGNAVQTKDLDMDLSYAKFRVREVEDMSITSKYSKIAIEEGGDITATSKYDTYDIGTLQEFRNTGKYDNIEIDNAGEVYINSKYTDIYLQNINSVLDLDLGYGAVSIENLKEGFSQVNIMGRYTDFRLNIDQNASYNIDATAEYAGIRYPNDLIITYEKDKGSYHEVKGHKGTPNQASVIKARLDYGGLRVRQD